MALSADNSAALAQFLSRALGAERVAIKNFAKLGGGAIQENWALDVDVEGVAR